MINGLDLFSGIGGISVALSPWVRPIAYCENDRHAQSVLLSRMLDGALPCGPIWDDIRTLTGDMLPSIDIIYGGFPCQDLSVAGTGDGLAGERSGLFFEILRIIEETKAPFVFLENVPGVRTRGLDVIIKEFSSRGYDCRWTVVSAAEVGAPHLRKRWFLLAYSNSSILREQSRRGSRSERESQKKFINNGQGTWGEAQPEFCRMDDGLPNRMDRLRGLGNAVVPKQAREAFKRLIGGLDE